jgi:hypothetical protein
MDRAPKCRETPGFAPANQEKTAVSLKYGDYPDERQSRSMSCKSELLRKESRINDMPQSSKQNIGSVDFQLPTGFEPSEEPSCDPRSALRAVTHFQATYPR